MRFACFCMSVMWMWRCPDRQVGRNAGGLCYKVYHANFVPLNFDTHRGGHSSKRCPESSSGMRPLCLAGPYICVIESSRCARGENVKWVNWSDIFQPWTHLLRQEQKLITAVFSRTIPHLQRPQRNLRWMQCTAHCYPRNFRCGGRIDMAH